jgi:LPS export ABC transporter protein LptC
MTAGFKKESLTKVAAFIVTGRKIIFYFTLMGALFFLLTSCENDLQKVNEVSSQKESLRETGKEVTAYYSDFGKVKAKLQAPVMNHINDPKNPYTELPSTLQLTFYNENLVPQSELTAGYGITYDKSSQMIARHNVVVINSSGEKLETEELVWDQKTEKISSEKFVKITTRDEIIFGDGFESNQDISNYKIKKIRGVMQLKDGELL